MDPRFQIIPELIGNLERRRSVDATEELEAYLRGFSPKGVQYGLDVLRRVCIPCPSCLGIHEILQGIGKDQVYSRHVALDTFIQIVPDVKSIP